MRLVGKKWPLRTANDAFMDTKNCSLIIAAQMPGLQCLDLGTHQYNSGINELFSDDLDQWPHRPDLKSLTDLVVSRPDLAINIVVLITEPLHPEPDLVDLLAQWTLKLRLRAVTLYKYLNLPFYAAIHTGRKMSSDYKVDRAKLIDDSVDADKGVTLSLSEETGHRTSMMHYFALRMVRWI